MSYGQPPGYGGHPHPHHPPPAGYGGPPQKRGPSAGTIAVSIFLGLCAVLMGSCMYCSKMASKGAEEFVEDIEKRAEERKKKRANPKRMDLEALTAAFDEGDEGDALLEEYVLTKGFVHELGDEKARRYLLIGATKTPAEADATRVQCILRLRTDADGISQGDEVTVLGEVKRRAVHVELADCSVE